MTAGRAVRREQLFEVSSVVQASGQPQERPAPLTWSPSQLQCAAKSGIFMSQITESESSQLASPTPPIAVQNSVRLSTSALSVAPTPSLASPFVFGVSLCAPSLHLSAPVLPQPRPRLCGPDTDRRRRRPQTVPHRGPASPARGTWVYVCVRGSIGGPGTGGRSISAGPTTLARTPGTTQPVCLSVRVCVACVRE